MSAHDRLKQAGIVPTTDCEKSYALGANDADELRAENRKLAERLERLNRTLTEIYLLAGRAR